MDLRCEVGRMGVRRLGALVTGLPSDAACYRNSQGWSHQDEMAALLVEQSDEWWRAYVQWRGGKKTRLPAGVKITRPKPQVVRVESDGQSDVAKAMAIMGQL